jgi:hypothetical protein
MAYTKTTWQDRVVKHPRRFIPAYNDDGSLDLIAEPGNVAQAGTPVNAARMNKIETGIADSVPKGASDAEVVQLRALLHEIDERSIELVRNNLDEVEEIREYAGDQLLQSYAIGRENGVVSYIQSADSTTQMRYNLVRDDHGALTHVTKERLI